MSRSTGDNEKPMYRRVSPRLWSGRTGKQIRRAGGSDALLLAAYLVTCPSSNQWGLYYLPLPTLCHETGLTEEGACKALRSLSEGVDEPFAKYDHDEEVVWIPNMAMWQVSESLKPTDNRVQGLRNKLPDLSKMPFFHEFLERYREAYSIEWEAPCKPLASPFGPPRKPGAVCSSSKQEQEQEQEQERELPRARNEPSSPPSPPPDPTDAERIADAVRAAQLDADPKAPLPPEPSWVMGARAVAARDFEELLATSSVDAVLEAVEWAKQDTEPGRNGWPGWRFKMRLDTFRRQYPTIRQAMIASRRQQDAKGTHARPSERSRFKGGEVEVFPRG